MMSAAVITLSTCCQYCTVIYIVNCCSPDDEYIAAGSSDGGVYIWEVATSKLHSVLKDHRSVFCLSTLCFIGSSLMQLELAVLFHRNHWVLYTLVTSK